MNNGPDYDPTAGRSGIQMAENTTKWLQKMTLNHATDQPCECRVHSVALGFDARFFFTLEPRVAQNELSSAPGFISAAMRRRQ